MKRTVKHVAIPEKDLVELVHSVGASFDGMRYTVPVKMRGGVWNKPIAYVDKTNGRYYKLVEV